MQSPFSTRRFLTWPLVFPSPLRASSTGRDQYSARSSRGVPLSVVFLHRRCGAVQQHRTSRCNCSAQFHCGRFSGFGAEVWVSTTMPVQNGVPAQSSTTRSRSQCLPRKIRFGVRTIDALLMRDGNWRARRSVRVAAAIPALRQGYRSLLRYRLPATAYRVCYRKELVNRTVTPMSLTLEIHHLKSAWGANEFHVPAVLRLSEKRASRCRQMLVHTTCFFN